jgi:HSP20 family molecular chaperone IbpA
MSHKTDIVKAGEKNIEKTRTLETVLPPVDIYESEEEILLFADMPGVLKEGVKVNIDNGTLSLSGIRKLQAKGAARWEEFGDVEYRRNFSVPQTINVEKVYAELKDGVLKLHLPKSEAAKPRLIQINAA